MIPHHLCCRIFAPNLEIAAAIARQIPEIRAQLAVGPVGQPPRVIAARSAQPTWLPEVGRRLGWLGMRPSLSPDLPADMIHFHVSLPPEDCQQTLEIRTDSYALAMALAPTLTPFFEDPIAVTVLPPSAEPMAIAVNGSTRLATLAAVVAGRGGARLAVKEQRERGLRRVILQVRAEALTLSDVPICIRSDDTVSAAALADRLRDAGCTDLRLQGLPTDRPVEAFRVHLGVLAARPADGRAATVAQIVQDFLLTLGVDPARWALETGDRPVEANPSEQGASLIPEILLPAALFDIGGLRPNRGTGPARFAVEVACEDFDEGRAVADRIEAAGFRGVLLTTPASTEIDGVIQMGALRQEPALLARLRAAAGAVLEPARLEVREEMGRQVRLVVPPRLTEGERVNRLRPRRARCRIVIRGSAQRRLQEALEELGFEDTLELPATERPRLNEIRYSHVDMADVEAVNRLISKLGGPHMDIAQDEDESEPEITVLLSHSLDGDALLTPVPVRAFGRWDRIPWRSVHPFVEAGETTVRVGDQSLPRRGAKQPMPPSLSHYVLDGSTAETLMHLVQSVQRREVVLLEGPTSTSKTSVILYLAALLGQPVSRINLSGQTETAELLGRYIPGTAEPNASGWRWVDGRLVAALRQGHWVVLDELNLAEPAMLERLNPLLEDSPSLLLAEHDGEHFGHGGTPIHPDFRVFATMNPSTYVGRSALSPALRDRFLGFRAVSSPTEADLRAMLEQLVLGETHPITVQGVTWAPRHAQSHLPWLGAPEPQVRALLAQLARLGVKLMALGDATTLTRSGRDLPVYSRRSLLAIVRAVAGDTATGHSLEDALRCALQRYLVARAVDPIDRSALAKLLDAVYLGPTAWSPGLEMDAGGSAERVSRSRAATEE